jgi:heptosyltransferase-2
VEKRNYKKVLVVQTAFIGDVVFASPIVHSVKEAYPQAKVTMLVRPQVQDLAKCIPGVDSILTFDERGKDSGSIGLLRTSWKVRCQDFDLLISPHRSARAALLSKMSSIPMRVGYTSGIGRWAYTAAVALGSTEMHSIEHDMKLLEAAGIEPLGTRLRLKEPVDGKQYIDGFYSKHSLTSEDKLIGLCIGAYWPTKRWPAVYFTSLAELLQDRGYTPVLLGGHKELSVEEEILNTLKKPVLSCVGNSLPESAALLQRCQAVVGGDSGLTHMAHALGVPSVIIYGPTNHKLHSFGENVKVLTALIKCRPCSSEGQRKCPKSHHDCMRLVSPEKVLDALRDLVNLKTPIPQVEEKEKEEVVVAVKPA